MSEFKPVETAADLGNLDADEIVEGYRAGLCRADEPGSNRSRSYWHGWRNAQADTGRMQPDQHQQNLARQMAGSFMVTH